MSAEFAQFEGDHPRPGRSRNPVLAPLAGVVLVLPASAWLWGYTVDDALITARVATHLAHGLGATFNPHGPRADAVTPLGYAQLLSLFGQRDVLHTFACAKWLGLGAWLVAAGLLARL